MLCEFETGFWLFAAKFTDIFKIKHRVESNKLFFFSLALKNVSDDGLKVGKVMISRSV